MLVATQNITVPKLRFEEFVGEWEEKTLGQTSEIIGGGTPETNNTTYWQGEIQWFTPTELKSKYVTVSKRTITELGLKKSSAKLLPEGTLLFSSRATVGDVAITKNICTTNQGFQSFIVNKENETEFLYNWIIQNKNEFIKKSSGSTFLEISKKEIQKLKLYLPTLPEQEKIASFLSAVDERIQKLERKKSLLAAYKKGVMRQLFSQEIRFKDENGNNYPDWQEKKLGDVFNGIKGKGLSKDKLDENGLNKCILYGELYTRYPEKIDVVINRTNSNEGVNSNKGDLLVPCSTTTSGIDLANVTAINEDTVKLGGDISILRAKVVLNNVFYAYYLSNYKKHDLAKYGQGTTIVHLYFSHFKSMKIDIPQIEEQQKIASFLCGIDKKIELVETQIQQSKTFKKGLLQQLFV